jgi:hypothetical protein
MGELPFGVELRRSFSGEFADEESAIWTATDALAALLTRIGVKCVPTGGGSGWVTIDPRPSSAWGRRAGNG